MFNFNPTTGLLDVNSFPSDPSTETEARQQFMTLFNQVKDYINANEIESGSNANGSYTKFPDGTMIAEREINVGDVSFTTQSTIGVFTGTYQEFYDFPIPFVDTPKVVPGVRSTGFMYIMLPSVTKTQVRVRMWAPYSSIQNAVNITLIAKGRWK